jgi:hypothetical protein
MAEVMEPFLKPNLHALSVNEAVHQLQLKERITGTSTVFARYQLDNW